MLPFICIYNSVRVNNNILLKELKRRSIPDFSSRPLFALVAMAAGSDAFERYFFLADVNRDGLISGQEAVSFFQGTGLSQQVLAEIWHNSDERKAGVLTKPEFYNALKLVTIAQAGNRLTPEIVKQVLSGLQISPPRMFPPSQASQGPPSFPGGPSQGNVPPAGYPSQVPPGGRMPPGPIAPTHVSHSQSLPPNQNFPPNQNLPGQWPTSSYNSQSAAPPPPRNAIPGQPGPGSVTGIQSLPSQIYGGPSQSSTAPPHRDPRSSTQQNFQDGSGSGGFKAGAWPDPNSQPGHSSGPPGPSSGISSLVPSGPLLNNSSGESSKIGLFADFGSFNFSSQHQPATSFSAVTTVSGNSVNSASGTASQGPPTGVKAPLPDDLFGGDPFAVSNSLQQPNRGPSNASIESSFLFPNATTLSPPSSVQQVSTTSQQGSQPENQNLIGSPRFGNSTFQASGPSQSLPVTQQATGLVGVSHSPPQPQNPPPNLVRQGVPTDNWPKMAVQDATRYTKIFAEVDTDRDQKITGREARQLFLGFGLPREVLKQVWDLADQDKDGALSHREFCSAMYLMDRFKEGRPLPQSLPTGIHFDEAGSSAPPTNIAAFRIAEAQEAVARNSAPAVWRLDPEMLSSSNSATVSASQNRGPMQTAVGQMPVSAADASAAVTGPLLYRSKAPPLEGHKVNQLDKDDAEKVRAKHREAEEADKKVWSTDAELLDSKQKMDFYKTKMQEIIMFKTRCDNRLNEITERASAEKREVEQLAKKYDEKYKQTEGVGSRLAQEEAALRDLQEKKSELYKAVMQLEHGAAGNSYLQEKADKLASELEDMRKMVNKKSKQLGLKVRPILGSDEVPFGWQPGLQENAVEWDDEWHDFMDEGFAPVHDIGDDVGPVTIDFNDPFPPTSNVPLEITKDPVPAEKHNGNVTTVEKGEWKDKNKEEKEEEEEKELEEEEMANEEERHVDFSKPTNDFRDQSHTVKDKIAFFESAVVHDSSDRDVVVNDRIYDKDYGKTPGYGGIEDHGYIESEDEFESVKAPQRYPERTESLNSSGRYEERQITFSRSNSTSVDGDAESSAADPLESGQVWTAFGQRQATDDDADSRARASWGF